MKYQYIGDPDPLFVLVPLPVGLLWNCDEAIGEIHPHQQLAMEATNAFAPVVRCVGGSDAVFFCDDMSFPLPCVVVSSSCIMLFRVSTSLGDEDLEEALLGWASTWRGVEGAVALFRFRSLGGKYVLLPALSSLEQARDKGEVVEMDLADGDLMVVQDYFELAELEATVYIVLGD